MTPIEYILRFVAPAAYALLPTRMQSTAATAMLVAIGLQESGFRARRQIGGSARGFWQFERAGVFGVMDHDRTNDVISRALVALQYPHTIDVEPAHEALAHNDVLAFCFARCLLWTSPLALGERSDARQAWTLYLDTWRPGKPREATWHAHYNASWMHVLDTRGGELRA